MLKVSFYNNVSNQSYFKKLVSAHYCPAPPGPVEEGGKVIVENAGMIYGMVCDGTDGNWIDIPGTGCDYNGTR